MLDGANVQSRQEVVTVYVGEVNQLNQKVEIMMGAFIVGIQCDEHS
jgi:hypothetical protein